MRRILAQARIELIQLSRDRLSMIFLWALPLVILIILGSTFKLTVSHLPLSCRTLMVQPPRANSRMLFALPTRFMLSHGQPIASRTTHSLWAKRELRLSSLRTLNGNYCEEGPRRFRCWPMAPMQIPPALSLDMSRPL